MGDTDEVSSSWFALASLGCWDHLGIELANCTLPYQINIS